MTHQTLREKVLTVLRFRSNQNSVISKDELNSLLDELQKSPPNKTESREEKASEEDDIKLKILHLAQQSQSNICRNRSLSSVQEAPESEEIKQRKQRVPTQDETQLEGDLDVQRRESSESNSMKKKVQYEVLQIHTANKRGEASLQHKDPISYYNNNSNF